MSKEFNIKTSEISSMVGGVIIGDPHLVITGINRIEDAIEGEITFYSDKKYFKHLSSGKASCIIIPNDIDNLPDNKKTYIRVKNPYSAFIILLNFINSQRESESGFIHPSAVIDKSAKIAGSVFIGPNCVVGKNCNIGENVVLKSNIVLYDEVTIGNESYIHSNSVLCSDTIIGKNCIIHPGVVIGSDGFGFVENKDGSYTKIPQLGNVIIGDNVEIGANSTIDRSVFGSTIIENGVKLDNLVHLAHNVKIGENTAMAAMVGISGSTKVGKRNRFGGQVGLAGHLETADDVVLAAQSGVPKSITEKGFYFGSPIKKSLLAFKIEASLNQLPDLIREFREFKNKINENKDLKD